jgi:hypothetical protein
MKPGLTLFHQNAESILKGLDFCCQNGSLNLKTGTGFVSKWLAVSTFGKVIRSLKQNVKMDV